MNDHSLRALGVGVLVITVWGLVFAWLYAKSLSTFDDCDDNWKLWRVALILWFCSPFILMIIFG